MRTDVDGERLTDANVKRKCRVHVNHALALRAEAGAEDARDGRDRRAHAAARERQHLDAARLGSLRLLHLLANVARVALRSARG